MERKTHTCTECGKEFEAGNYFGCHDNTSLEHKVEAKTYYSASARNYISVKPDRTFMDGHGARMTVGGKDIHFTNGIAMTTDPETQDILDTLKSLLTKEQYTELNLTPEQKNARLRTMLTEQGSLLEKAKQDAEQWRQKAEGAPPQEPEPARAARR